MRGRQGTTGDAAGKAVNRKVVGSSPSSGANSEYGSDSAATLNHGLGLSNASGFLRNSRMDYGFWRCRTATSLVGVGRERHFVMGPTTGLRLLPPPLSS